MNAFVGVSQKLFDAGELKSLLQQPKWQPCYYCLRWFHAISPFEKQLPEPFPSPEGQLLNEHLELRWKQKGSDQFSLLLLSTQGPEDGFQPIGDTWITQQRDAHLYPPTETRFPNPGSDFHLNIAQRYFIDRQTSTVRFVALTIKGQNGT
jgi:hypothetical protein